jgi:hypothetical protein
MYNYVKGAKKFMPYVGDISNINVSSDDFESFIRGSYLYVDKTQFVEHLLRHKAKTAENDNAVGGNEVLLFTRPRRMGKSLNLNTLYTFLDNSRDTRDLFSNLYISRSNLFSEINQHPVIFLNFKNYGFERFYQRLRDDIVKFIENNIEEMKYTKKIKRYLLDEADYDETILIEVMEVIYKKTGKKMWVLIDEYDKVIIDNVKEDGLQKLCNYLKEFLSATCKSNKNLYKAVLTGVTRIAKANMFSDLNNLDVYDVFRASEFDTSFALTEDEVLSLVSVEQLEEVRNWYNNLIVGNARLFNIYSVMSYLKRQYADYFWDMTGNARLLMELMTPARAEFIQNLQIDGDAMDIALTDSIELMMLTDKACEDKVFFSLAIQAGYLSCIVNRQGTHTTYTVYIPNWETYTIWSRILAGTIFRESMSLTIDAFKYLQNIKEFEKKLTNAVSLQLSYHDISGHDREKEKMFHGFVLGIIVGLGYRVESNRELGLGRPDLVVDTGSAYVIIEFKIVSKKFPTIEKAMQGAFKQINDNKYFDGLKNNIYTKKSIYKVGVGFKGKECQVKAELHNDVSKPSKTKNNFD